MALWMLKLIPLRHIPDLQVRHMIMQILAFMWSAVFALYIANSVMAFGISAFLHVLLVGAVLVTVGTFKVAEHPPMEIWSSKITPMVEAEDM